MIQLSESQIATEISVSINQGKFKYLNIVIKIILNRLF